MNDLPEVVAYQDYSIDDTDTVTDTITTIANTISDTIISKDTNSNTHSRTNTNINTDTVLNTIGKTMNYLDSYSNTYSDSNDHSVSKDHNNNYDNNEKEDDEHLATIDLSWLSHHYNIIIYIMILFSFSIAFTIGYSLVGYCRRECRKVTQPYKLTLLLFIIPLFIFLISNIFLLFHWCSQSVADAFSFGTFVGIIFKLAEKPGGKELLKLTVIQVNKKKNDVWLKSADVTVGEARRVIATALDIIPYNRIFIESGKGNFLEDNNLILINELDDSLLRTDFFGFVTTSCFVHIKEEDPKARVTFQEDNEKLNNAHKSPKHNQLKALLKGEARYGDPLGISAKVPNSNNTQDSDYFGISLVDKFAASAPISLQHPTTVIKFISWSAAAAAFGATPDNMSEIGEVSSVSSATVTPTKWSLFSRKKSSNDMYSGKPIRNGDSVVIESGGKFMSVARGWWMAWYSPIPRRSGAFIIEITDKVPSNKLKEQIKGQIESMKTRKGRKDSFSPSAPTPITTSNTIGMDSILRPGDSFRLRSVKFPDFELGITSVKLRDNYYYLGLRKIEETEEHDQAQGWCTGVRFTVKSHILGSELFKMGNA